MPTVESAAVGVEDASGRIAERFTRMMRAATSRCPVLTDPPVICAGVAVAVLTSVILYNLAIIGRPQLPVVYAAIAVPILTAMGVHAALRGARGEVVEWLGGLPFPVDNLNGLLNGVAEHLVVRFVGDAPSRQTMTDMLDAIHVDCFALDFHDDEPEVCLVIGVPENKLNPAGTNHRRYLRARRMIDECLVALTREFPIESVRVA